MDNNQDASVEALRSKSERTRAALAGTVNELRERVSDTAAELKTMASPSYIKEEIRSFVRQERESIMQSLERKVRDNPLQAAAVGAALAYPALGLLRAIPGPLLMIGAGLFLTSARGKQTLADVGSKASEAVNQGLVQASTMADGLRDAVTERAEGVSHALEEAGAAVTERTDAVAAGLRRNIHDVRDAAASGVSAITGKVSAATGAVSHSASQVYAETRTTVGSASDRSKSAVMDWVNQNPMLVAGIGAAVGAFIASALPPSPAENRVLGRSSDALKDKAREAAAEGLDKAKDMAAQVVGDVTAAAAREGLDPATLKQAADKITDSVKSVAERGVKSALSGIAAPDTQPSQHN